MAMEQIFESWALSGQRVEINKLDSGKASIKVGRSEAFISKEDMEKLMTVLVANYATEEK